MDRQDEPREINRREFLQLTAGAIAVGAGLAPHGGALSGADGEMPYRTLGKTGMRVSLVGLGGYHIGNPAAEEGVRIIRSAIDRGINFLDNCWDYHDGDSEVRMGRALRDGYRERVFLMTKIDGQTSAAASRQLDESLRRLQTDRIDLVQCHEVIRPGDPDRIFGTGGSIEALTAARQAGKLRFIGFTGHKSPAIHLKMLETAAAHAFTFDAVQMPLNVMDAHFDSFEQRVLPVLVQRGIGVLGMKPLGSGAVLQSRAVSAMEALHYAMSLPTSVVITGCDSMNRLSQALEAARTFRPLTRAQVSELLARTAAPARDGRYEPYKTTQGFDGTVHRPDFLG
jgi:aryl-alcohol dehydrogenase-like predicted oxidoreductase